MKPLLLGVDSLSYSSFMKCSPKFLMMLFGSTFRGVVVNRSPQHPASSWMKVLQMEVEEKNFLTKLDEAPKLLKDTGAVAVNLPITNPTYGELRLNYFDGLSAEEEVNKVVEAILNEIDDQPVVADITLLDRLLHKSSQNKCSLYKIVDDTVKKLINKVDEFILFSPYGEPKSDKMCDHEDYGVYLASEPRPNEHDVVKLEEIGLLFKKIVKGY
ncbi:MULTISPECIES: hypothetical protein [Acidianus]|uniref:Uncharacterized protein n=1 Tax=Candidatus Acidianus copahuensis TaxID=1160895 RepID=A0A031LI83_9CREN|nr:MULTISPECIES: hypothetical protein [Acidianus]EZQ01827.1 hypothetical protein CM19_12215 [Candidatus Acidianus copahuensis]NON63605.1 hypothetical protein [Acidianus sp. RZ1]